MCTPIVSVVLTQYEPGLLFRPWAMMPFLQTTAHCTRCQQAASSLPECP